MADLLHRLEWLHDAGVRKGIYLAVQKLVPDSNPARDMIFLDLIKEYESENAERAEGEDRRQEGSPL